MCKVVCNMELVDGDWIVLDSNGGKKTEVQELTGLLESWQSIINRDHDPCCRCSTFSCCHGSQTMQNDRHQDFFWSKRDTRV